MCKLVSASQENEKEQPKGGKVLIEKLRGAGHGLVLFMYLLSFKLFQ